MTLLYLIDCPSNKASPAFVADVEQASAVNRRLSRQTHDMPNHEGGADKTTRRVLARTHRFLVVMAGMLLGISGANVLAQSCGAVPTSIGGVGTPVVAGSGDLSVGNNSYVVGDAGTTNTSGSGTSMSVGTGVGPPGQPLPGFQPTTFPTVGGSNTSAGTIAAGSWGKITIGSPTTFSGGTYYISEISAGNSKSINFAAGDYFIDKFSAGNDLVVTVTSGPVRLFIKTSFEAGNQSTFNSGGSPANFQIFVYDNASVQFGNSNNGNTNVSFNGLIYAPGTNTSISFGNNNVVQGAVLSGGNVSVGNNTGVIFDSATQAAIAGLDSCQLVGEFRFDECSLTSGSAGALKDSSRYARHGTPYGFSTGSGKVYNGGNFSATGTADYAILNNAIVSGLTSLTVSLWFKTSVSKTQQELIQAVNSSVADQLELFIANGNGIYVKLAGAEKTFTKAGGNVADGIWHHLMVVRDTTVATAKPNVCVYVDGAIWGACDNNSTFNKTALSVAANGFVVGQEQDSVGGSFNSGQALEGYLDELVLFASPLVAADASAIYTAQSAGTKNWNGTSRTNACPSGPHHLEIQDSTGGSGLTCTPSTLTIRACADANSPCGVYTAGVSGTLAASGGATVNWGAASAAFAIPSGSSTTTKTMQVTTVGSVTVATSGLSPAATSATTCTFPSPANTCIYTSADAGLLFDVPHHVAELAQTVTVSAVKKSDNSLTCTPAFASTSKSVNFKCSYGNPAAGAVSGQLPVRVAGVALNAGNSTATACDATGNSVSLAFNASGVASTTLQYADVGNMTLSATYTGSGSDAGLTMTGSDSFIAAPKDFALSAVTAGPIGAGNAFSATVTARNNAGAATPSFGKESVAESATLSLGSRVAPAGANDCVNGPCNGTVAGSVTLPWSGGAATASNLSYSEVGQITLAATLASGSYLGSGLTATGTSATVGAFVPAYFDTAVTQSCAAGSFTYSAQPFRVDVTARNATAGTTVNYSNLAGCLVCSKDVTLSDPAATINFNGTNSILATAFAKGVGTRSTVKYTFPTTPSAPAAITLRAIDASVTPSVSSSGHTEGAAAIRSGRLQLSNVFGTGSLQLPVQIRYWSGQSWVLNSDDSCTVLPKGSTGLSGATGTLIASPPTVSCVSSPTNYCSGVDFKIVGGLSYIKLTPAALTASGSVNVCADLGADPVGGTVCNVSASGLSYLQGKWPPGTGYDNDPVARATFGVYATETRKSVHVREQF